jgi:hypothetical protein
VGLLDLFFAVIGADMAVDVEQPDRIGMCREVAPGEAGDEPVCALLAGELGQAEAEARDLRGAVEAEQAADRCRVEPGEARSP